MGGRKRAEFSPCFSLSKNLVNGAKIGVFDRNNFGIIDRGGIVVRVAFASIKKEAGKDFVD